MKNKLFVAVIAVLAIVAVVLALLFVDCGGPPAQKTVDKVYLGGIISFGSQNQLFAKIAVGVPHSKSDYKAKIEGLPKTLEVSTINGIRSGFYEIDFFVVSATSNMGEFPYKITVFNDKETNVFEGILTIAKVSASQDLVAGGPGKTGFLGNISMSGLAVTATVKTGKLILSNPVISRDFVIAGLSTGEIIGVTFDGNIKWKTQTTKNIIETMQILGDKLITSDNGGVVSLFSIEALSKGEKGAESTYRINGTLSAPPTILDDKTIVMGTTDGLVVMMSLPNLDKVWEVKRLGAIMGPISAIPIGAEKGSLFFNCADNNTYIVGFDSQLVTRLQNNQQTIGSPVAMTDRFAINSKPNKVQLRDTSGREKWIFYCDFDVTGMPLMTSDQVFAYGRTKLAAISMQDGTELWSVDMPSAINSNLVIAGNHILVPTEDKTVTILRTNDGLVTGTFKVEGSVIPWPFARDGRLVVADRIGNLMIFGKTDSVLAKKFDMSQVVVNGGSVSLSHNSLVKANFPTKPKLLWSKSGSFAPAVTTIGRLFLYDLDRKVFSCVESRDGETVWEYAAEAAEGMFYGLGMEKGPHDTPMFFSEKGLLLGVRDGLAIVDPDTGKLLAKSIHSGIPQCDGKYIALSSPKELLLLDMNMNVLWRKKGFYSSSNVCLDGDFIFAAKRGEETGSFQIIEAKTGKIFYEEEDQLFGASAIKVLSTKRYIIVSTLQGPWVYDKEKAKVNGTSGSLSQTGLGVYEANEVNGKIYCSTEEFGLVFDLETGIGSPVIPKDAFSNKARLVSGHWLFSPNMYICMGMDGTNEKDLKDPDKGIPKLLQIRNLDGSTVSSIKLPTSTIFRFGISASGSVIILSEIGKGASLKVYGP